MGSCGTDLLIDFNISDPRAISYATRAAWSLHFAMLLNEARKGKKYTFICNQLGCSFLGATLEIFGCMTERLQNLIKDLVSRASERSMIPESILLPYWTKRISMTIQRGNAKYWMASTVRMSGANVLHDESMQNETHHIRTIT
jgi:hypothetical protein